MLNQILSKIFIAMLTVPFLCGIFSSCKKDYPKDIPKCLRDSIRKWKKEEPYPNATYQNLYSKKELQEWEYGGAIYFAFVRYYSGYPAGYFVQLFSCDKGFYQDTIANSIKDKLSYPNLNNGYNLKRVIWIPSEDVNKPK